MRKPQRTNQTKDSVNKAGHSMNIDRGKQEPGSRMRSKATIKRLQMQRNFKPKRNKHGKIVQAAPFQNELKSGTQARVEPNRRWFGNTRVIGQGALQAFQEAMGKVKRDPNQVVLRATKAPITLLNETAKRERPVHILDMESFQWTFGKKAQRKKPKWEHDTLEDYVATAAQQEQIFEKKREGDVVLKEGEDVDKDLVSEAHFKAGQSRRVWNELYKVLDSSDVVFYVLDARDPLGTRSRRIEDFLRKEKAHKHLVLVLNKVDLIPKWVAKRWISVLSKEYPTVAFRAHLTNPFGKKTLLSLMRQYPTLYKDRKQISIGVIGYPNVGKSSVINTLKSKKVCKVAPIAGETKVWQYVKMMSKIYLIDCPGVVYPEGATETELVLKGVVRVEYLHTPEMYVDEVLKRVRTSYLCRFYGLEPPTGYVESFAVTEPSADPAAVEEEVPDGIPTQSSGAGAWPVTDDFLELLARRRGKLLRGGEPDLNCVAKMVLNDFQRGQLPFFSRPPGPRKQPDPEKAAKKQTRKKKEVAAVDVVQDKVEAEKRVEEVEDIEELPEDADEAQYIPMLPSSEDEAEVAPVPAPTATRKRRREMVEEVEDEEEAPAAKKLTSKERRKADREARPKKIGQHFYAFANVKNRNLARRIDKRQNQSETAANQSAPKPSKNNTRGRGKKR